MPPVACCRYGPTAVLAVWAHQSPQRRLVEVAGQRGQPGLKKHKSQCKEGMLASLSSSPHFTFHILAKRSAEKCDGGVLESDDDHPSLL
jgi:hypothetical protein